MENLVLRERILFLFIVLLLLVLTFGLLLIEAHAQGYPLLNTMSPYLLFNPLNSLFSAPSNGLYMGLGTLPVVTMPHLSDLFTGLGTQNGLSPLTQASAFSSPLLGLSTQNGMSPYIPILPFSDPYNGLGALNGLFTPNQPSPFPLTGVYSLNNSIIGLFHPYGEDGPAVPGMPWDKCTYTDYATGDTHCLWLLFDPTSGMPLNGIWGPKISSGE